MATFFKSSQVWVIDFLYDGRERRWLKALPAGSDGPAQAARILQELYGAHARLEAARPATPEEDDDYRHGRLPRNAYCPSGKAPLSPPRPPR